MDLFSCIVVFPEEILRSSGAVETETNCDPRSVSRYPWVIFHQEALRDHALNHLRTQRVERPACDRDFLVTDFVYCADFINALEVPSLFGVMLLLFFFAH